MRVLADDEPFTLYPVPEAGGLPAVLDDRHTAAIERAIAGTAPAVPYRLLRNPPHRSSTWQYYCVEGGEIRGVTFRTPNTTGNMMYELHRYIADHHAPGRVRRAYLPGFFGRLLHADPWLDWWSLSVEQAKDQVARWRPLLRDE